MLLYDYSSLVDWSILSVQKCIHLCSNVLFMLAVINTLFSIFLSWFIGRGCEDAEPDD